MWSTELYKHNNLNTCPHCANIYYRTRLLGGKLYKKCEECGRVSAVTDEDQLIEVVDD